MQWPYENATRGVVGPSPQRHPWSQWSRLLNFGRAFEVCLSETWQRLQATGQGDESLCSNLAYIYELVWIIFFWFSLRWSFCLILFALTPSPDHYRGLRKRFSFAYCIDLLLKGTRKETTYHSPRPFIFYHYLSNFQYAILTIILGRETKTFFC